MRAVIQEAYGSADVLHLKAVKRPTPADDEVLIRVRAAAVTPSDCAFRKGDPFATRLFNGLRRPKFTPGDLLAGEVEQVGKSVTMFKVGDRVFGSAGPKFGAHAEYKCLSEHGALARLPDDMSFEEGVAVCDGGMTALHFLREAAALRPGQTLLVNGASGSVGAAAIQLGKHFGAMVTGVCGRTNVGLVRSLGADEIIDYTTTDFTRTGATYDVIFDAVGKSTFGKCRASLTPKGTYLTTEPSLRGLVLTAWTAKSWGKKARVVFAWLSQSKEKVMKLRELWQVGAYTPVIDSVQPIERVADAHRLCRTRA